MQATGSLARVAFWDESTWGVTPGSPSIYLLGAATEGVGLKGAVEKLLSKAISSLRGTRNSRGGNINAGGSIPFELPTHGIGRLLKHAIGQAVSGRHGVQGPGLTGITTRYVQSTCPTGAGTLTLSGSNLTWTANGDTAGAAVNVSAAGEYTLQSGTAGRAIYITSAGAPSGPSATVTVSSTLYKHTIKRGALPAGFGVELGYTDIGVYHVATGGRIDKFDLSLGTSGFATGSMDVIAKDFDPDNASPLGTPLSVSHVPYVHHEAVLLDGGVAANFVNFSLSLENQHDQTRKVGSRNLLSAREGQGALTGKVELLFESSAASARVLNETSTEFDITFSNGTSSFRLRMPNVKFFGDVGVGIPTSQGLLQSLDWSADVDTAITNSDVIVEIVNTETSI